MTLRHAANLPALLLAGSFALFGLPRASLAADTPAPQPSVHKLRAKSGLGVAVSYTLTPPVAGQPSVLTLNTTSSEPAGAVAMTVRPDAGLTLVSQDLVADVPQPLQASQTFRLEVTPAKDGLYYLHLFLREGARGRAMAIAVPVGDAKASLNKGMRVQSVKGGGSVISVPAQ